MNKNKKTQGKIREFLDYEISKIIFLIIFTLHFGVLAIIDVSIIKSVSTSISNPLYGILTLLFIILIRPISIIIHKIFITIFYLTDVNYNVVDYNYSAIPYIFLFSFLMSLTWLKIQRDKKITIGHTLWLMLVTWFLVLIIGVIFFGGQISE